jgi:hypothetical protein
VERTAYNVRIVLGNAFSTRHDVPVRPRVSSLLITQRNIRMSQWYYRVHDDADLPELMPKQGTIAMNLIGTRTVCGDVFRKIGRLHG